MIRVLSISIYKSDSSGKIAYESFRDKQFESHDDVRDWIAYQERIWTDIKGFECRVYPVIRSKPEKKIDMQAVLVHTAHVMGQPLDGVLSASRKREFVDVRKIACMIIMDMDYQPMEIERQLPFKNRTVYSYRESIENRMATERGFEDSYNEIKKKVKSLIYPEKNENEQRQV